MTTEPRRVVSLRQPGLRSRPPAEVKPAAEAAPQALTALDHLVAIAVVLDAMAGRPPVVLQGERARDYHDIADGMTELRTSINDFLAARRPAVDSDDR